MDPQEACLNPPVPAGGTAGNKGSHLSAWARGGPHHLCVFKDNSSEQQDPGNNLNIHQDRAG